VLAVDVRMLLCSLLLPWILAAAALLALFYALLLHVLCPGLLSLFIHEVVHATIDLDAHLTSPSHYCCLISCAMPLLWPSWLTTVSSSCF
jgi:hypothetical protein